MGLNFGHYLLILFLMLFLHVVDDYYLQGILAKLKQKSWWEENAPNSLYKNDYICALAVHAFSWSFVITLPWFIIAFLSLDTGLIIFLILGYLCNTFIHALVDHMKANEQVINLLKDQQIHFYQIITTWVILTLSYII
jgi:hypothetical protein